MLTISNLSVTLKQRALLRGVDLSVVAGELVCLLGPNGVGKSTLLKAVSGEFPIREGSVLLNDRNDWPLQQRAQMMAVLPQASSLSFAFKVLEVVLLGRIPHQTSRVRNVEIARSALESVDSAHLIDRTYIELSGGERQRVHLARVLAQLWEPAKQGGRLLLLDEPTSAMDPAHQQLTLQRARQCADDGWGVLVVLHDLNLAARFADKLVILQQGEIAVEGSPAKVLTPTNIRQVFNIESTVIKHPQHGCPLVITH